LRITNLYKIENQKGIKEKIGKLIADEIEALAEAKFKDEPFQMFEIKVKLEPINRFGMYG